MNSYCLTFHFTPFFKVKHFEIYIIDRFLFVEANKHEGIKGIDYTTHKFKLCKKLNDNVDVQKIRAFYSENCIQIVTHSLNTQELEIDKRRARNMIRAIALWSGEQKPNIHIENFLIWLRND